MISTKGRYALRVMLDLAQQEEGSPVSLRSIAQRQGISKKYLEIIVKALVTHRLISGESGKGGGYKLSRNKEDYTVGEIIEAAEGPLVPVACLMENAQACPRAKECMTLPFWIEYGKLTHDFLFSKKLTDLLS